ncbi:unnamed protein product [Dovyalis caffra]|uniref:Uncharacterized protein n=1 Tax=Dovyalis caffra TaxID=77055 RepID=A0AAV1S5B0_9ROSI|nr:unnamed protein product [Dovyalis caffra]
MAKSFHYVLFIVALDDAVAISNVMVEATDCRREIGVCTADCNEVCASRYPYDGQGGCENDKEA